MANLGSEEELQQRLAALGATHSMRGLFFNSVLEVVRLLGDASAVERCLEVAGESRFVDFFSYPTHAYIRMLYTAAGLLGDRYGGFEGTLREMGSRTILKFLASAAGRAVRAVVDRNPRRVVQNIPVVHGMVVKGGTCSLKWVGATSGILVIEGVSAPAPFIEGALQSLFDATNVVGAKVSSRQLAPLDVEFTVSWE